MEVDRSGLVAGFVGQTALKTGEVIEKALAACCSSTRPMPWPNPGTPPNDTSGREAIETLLKGMEDHRDDLIVIAAGYTELMGRFLHANPAWRAASTSILLRGLQRAQLLAIFSPCVRKMGIRWMIKRRNMPNRISNTL